jgi:transcriptional regulator with XRE-family HTH domain
MFIVEYFVIIIEVKGVIGLLSERLLKLRKEAKLTQEGLSLKLKMARTTYSGYELGTSEPDNETLEKIADFYGVTTDYLLGREESKKPTVSDLELSDDELMQKYKIVLDGKPIDDDIIREVLSYVRARRLTK